MSKVQDVEESETRTPILIVLLSALVGAIVAQIIRPSVVWDTLLLGAFVGLLIGVIIVLTVDYAAFRFNERNL